MRKFISLEKAKASVQVNQKYPATFAQNSPNKATGKALNNTQSWQTKSAVNKMETKYTAHTQKSN